MFVPQITGGATVPPVTEKVSVKQLVKAETSFPAFAAPPTEPRVSLA